MSLFLASAAFDRLADWLESNRVGGPAVVITNASKALADGAEIVAGALTALAAANRQALPLDVEGGDLTPIAAAGAIVMTGGDPFALLAALNRSGAAPLIRAAHRRGVPIAGQSAGALVCGPTLAPARLTSPFAAPANLDLSALRLTSLVVLPHHDRAGRAAQHREAARAFRSDTALTPLWDDEVLLVGEVGVPPDQGAGADHWHVERDAYRTRPAARSDADGVMEVFQAAAGAAWADFIGADRLRAAGANADPAEWAARMEPGGGGFLVTEDAVGLCGFVLYRPVSDGLPGRTTGEIDLLYTHPRVWRRGIGRRLLDRATWNLYCLGCDAAVLWTEARNERALAVYRANGWRADGAVSEREYLGVPIRNLRHRLDLARYAGGA